MMLFAFLGVFGEGRVLKANIFDSGIEMVSFYQMTPKKSIVVCAIFSLLGRILMFPSLSLEWSLESLCMCSSRGPFVASMMSSA